MTCKQLDEGETNCIGASKSQVLPDHEQSSFAGTYTIIFLRNYH